MKMKKILIVSRSFYPENSPRSHRTTELVKEFARRGHDVTLITLKDEDLHGSFEREFGIQIKDLGKLRFPSIDLKGSTGLSRLVKRGIRRLLLMLFEYPDIELMYRVQRAIKAESGYDLLISIATPYPVHWGVAWAWRTDYPIAQTWVADCGDPYYGLENDSFNKLFYFAWIEKWFCRKVDYITIPYKGGQSAYFEEFHSKIRVIPQGFSFPQRRDTSHNESGLITFAYFGNIKSYLHYAVPFLEKLNTIDRPYKFIVYTRRKELFKKILTREALGKCVLRNYVERDVLLQELSGVDFLVHFPYQNDSQKSLKLVDYNFLQKPILVYKNDTFSDRVFEEFLEYNFENKRDFKDYRKYRIENVCTQFLQLTQESMPLMASVQR
ncbi:glycosyltransferase [Fodinibius sediminis]|nr:glycosyltransferase [Fodinibius sediminis]